MREERLTAKTPRTPRKTKKGIFATDLNQMHTDGRRGVFFLAGLASWRFSLALILGLVVFVGRAVADDSGGVPFYYAVGSRFEPQITTLVVGENERAGQAVHSRDQKYVSLNVDTSLLNSAGVRRFQYQKGGLGFVGSDAGAKSVPVSAGNGLTPSIAGLPSEIAPPVSILDKRGMVLVMPLER